MYVMSCPFEMESSINIDLSQYNFPFSVSYTPSSLCLYQRVFVVVFCILSNKTRYTIFAALLSLSLHALGASIWHPLNMSSRFSAVPHISTSVGLYCVFTNDIFPVIKSCNYMVLYRTSQFQEIGFPTSVIDRRVYHLYMEHLEYFRIFHVEAFYVRFQFPRHLLLELHVQWLYSISIEVAAFTIIWCRCYCGKFSVSFLYLVVKSPEVYSKRCTKYSNKARCFATNISCFFRSKE